MVSIALCLCMSVMDAVSVRDKQVPDEHVPIVWQTHYADAVRLAQAEHRMLLIHFAAATTNVAVIRFERQTLHDPTLVDGLREHVCLKLSLHSVQDSAKDSRAFVQHAAFRYMHGGAGVAVIDFHDRSSPHWSMVVTQLPFASIGYPNVERMRVILDLPHASLTQRTLIYAVRTHPEMPASASQALDPVLMSEAEKHSERQAVLCNQGHHQWDTRFQQISYRTPAGLAPQEVCAESWPNQDLVEAAVECVHSWRQSPGHWSAVRRRQPLFGYDMKLGRNGIWYATGLFANRGG